jgi:hypothetical protein
MPGDNWGPFAAAISHAEMVARLRTLRAFVQVCQPDRLHPLLKALWLAESGEAAEVEAARLELDRLPALTLRRVLGCYAAHYAFKTEVPDGKAAPARLLQGAG